MRKILAIIALALALVTTGLTVPATAAPVRTVVAAADCKFPSQVPTGIPTGPGSTWESGMWVFQSAVLHTSYKAGLCQVFGTGRIIDSPATSTIKVRLAIEPAGGTSFNEFTAWFTVLYNSATATLIDLSMPDYVAFKLETQTRATNSSALYCSTTHCS